jgi:CRISPR/Cas system CSM-associated protein Csm5 (group 7 of RAMP superfamily)
MVVKNQNFKYYVTGTALQGYIYSASFHNNTTKDHPHFTEKETEAQRSE